MALNPSANFDPSTARLADEGAGGFDPTTAVLAPDGPKRTFTGTLRDVGVAALKSAVAVPQSAVGLLDIPTGGRVGKRLESVGLRFKDAQDILADQYSDAQKARQREVDQAEGFVDTAKAMVANPSTIATAAGESLAPMFAGGAGARLLGLAKRFGPVAAGAIGEGMVGAGSAASQIREQTDDGLLTPKQAALAGLSGVGTAALGLAGGKVAQRLGIRRGVGA